MMIKDPNNPFMRKLTLEGDQGMQELQRADIWKSILAKKEFYNKNLNEFLNSLSDDEFSEFIQERDIPEEKLTETGRASELSGFDFAKETAIDSKEQFL